MKNWISLLVLLGFGLQSVYSQVNDNCANAIALTVGSECSLQRYSNENATSEGSTIAPDPTCGSFVGTDVWFKTTMPASGALRVEVDNPFGAVPPSFTVYSGDCGDFQEIACARNDHNRTINNPAIAGELIFIRVYSHFSTVGRPFDLCIYEPDIPTNDQCENALMLQVEESCKPVQHRNIFSTAQGDVVAPQPVCGEYRGGDIWFKALMPATGTLRIGKERITGATHPSMVAYTGSCTSFQPIFCSPNEPTATISNPSLAGELIYLRFFSYANDEGAIFSLCLYEEDSPANDHCADAIMIPIGTECSPEGYTNRQATEEDAASVPVPSCMSYRGGDVWFKAVVPASGKLQIMTESQYGSVPPSITLYSGTCQGLSELECIENQDSFLLSDNSLAGQTIFLRVFSYAKKEGFNFFLCAFEPPCSYTIDGGEISICKNDSYKFGSQVISQPGDYTELFKTNEGCDSLVTLTLTISDIDTRVTNNNGVLTALAAGAQYQWIDCSNGFKPIASANTKSFSADLGEYAVIITQNSCVDTSACHQLSLVVDVEDEIDDDVIVFPNPAGHSFYINFQKSHTNATMEMVDTKGRIVNTKSFYRKSIGEVDTRGLASGPYIIRLRTSNGILTRKLIKR